MRTTTDANAETQASVIVALLINPEAAEGIVAQLTESLPC